MRLMEEKRIRTVRTGEWQLPTRGLSGLGIQVHEHSHQLRQ